MRSEHDAVYAFKRRFNQSIDIQVRLRFLEEGHAPSGHRMLGHKECAAIIMGQNRGLKGINSASEVDDLGFVVGDQRPLGHSTGYRVDDVQIFHGLTGDLDEVFSSAQGSSVNTGGQAVGNSVHEPAVEQDRQTGITPRFDRLLDIRKWDDVQGHSTLPWSELAP